MVTKIDITPDVSLLQKAGAVNYKIPQALAEFGDNSIDEALPGRKLHLEVKLGQRGGEKFILVADDARGMTEEQAAKAMVMAHSNKKPGKIGEFGLGMKTAASNLGAHFEIVTATKEAEKATRIVYDEEDFLSTGKWELRMEQVDKPFEHGTVITVTKLKVKLYAGLKDVVIDKFGKIFKHFIADGGVEIIVNDEQVEPFIPDVISDYYTEINFEVNGKSVRGWASLLSKGSGKGKYGFDLVRGNRVMIRYEKIGFAPGPGTTRITGELHLNDFSVTNNKTDFRRDTDDWYDLNKTLKEELVDLVRVSRKMANPGASKLDPKDQVEVDNYIGDVKEALKSDDLQGDLDRRALDSALADEFTDGPLPFTVPGDEKDGDDQSTDSKQGSTNGQTDGTKREPSYVDQHRLQRVKTQLRNLAIEHSVSRLGKDNLYKLWDIEGVANRKKLVVITNSDHPIYEAMRDSFLIWIKHNIAEAVAEYFTETTGKTESMLLIKSDILKHVAKLNLQEFEETTYPDVEETKETTA